MVDIKKYLNKDLYGLLGIDISAEHAEIRKAYRKKALACHPDKNPDNPKAAELFHELSKALEILSDESARAAYDRVILARKAAEIRNKQLDSKRQKLKSELEAREKAAERAGAYATLTKPPEEALREVLERLRSEGSRLLEEEQKLMQQQMAEELLKQANPVWNSAQNRIKITWTAAKTDATNGGYSEDNLRRFLQKYGDLEAFVMSGKRNGSAMVEFRTQDAAEMAVAYEKGLLENPLSLGWIGSASSSSKKGVGGAKPTSTTVTGTDYESLVLRQMRQAEERKRLIEQMLREEKEEGES